MEDERPVIHSISPDQPSSFGALRRLHRQRLQYFASLPGLPVTDTPEPMQQLPDMVRETETRPLPAAKKQFRQFAPMLQDDEQDSQAWKKNYLSHLATDQVPAVPATPRFADETKLTTESIDDLITRPVLAVVSGNLNGIDPRFHAPPPAFATASTAPLLPAIPTTPVNGVGAVESKASASEISGAAANAALVGIGNVSGNMLKYVSGVIIARGFSSGLFGLYSASFALVTLISSVFELGLDNAMIRYVAVYRSKRQGSSMRGLILFCTALSGIAGIVGALFLLFTARFFAHDVYDKNQLMTFLLVMSPMIPLLCMQGIWFGGLQGLKAFKWRVLSERFLPPIILILLLVIGIALHLHAVYISLAALVSTLIGTVCGLYFLFRSFSRVAKAEPEQYQTREWVGFALPVFLSAIIDILLDATDTLLLLFYRVSELQLAQYSASIKVSSFVSMPLVSLNAIFSPTIAELHSKGEREKLAQMFKVVTKWSITFSLPFFLLASLLSRSILSVSANDIANGWPLLIALSLGQMINASTGSVGYMLIMTGHQRVTFINTLAAIIVNIVLGIVLTPRYGAFGTAISTGCAEIVVNSVRLLQVWIFLRMQPYRWDSLKPFGAGIISSGITGGLIYLMVMHRVHPLLQLGVAPVFVMTYIGLILLFKLSPEDAIVVNALRKKFGRGKK